MTTNRKVQLFCQLSGVQIATMEFVASTGLQPYIKSWNAMVLQHPIFSLSSAELLAFARGEWRRLSKLADDEQASDAEEQTLQICFLAMLHSLDSIRQTIPSLPPLAVVQTNMEPLFKLAYWKHFLDSKRFRFPTYRIAKENTNSDFSGLAAYLALCFQIKLDYETEVSEIDEDVKKKAAEKALKQLRNSWIAPPSNKQLYKWVRANLPAKYEAESQGWMATLFCGSERTILNFEDTDKDLLADIQLLDEIISCECPNGTGLMFAVRKRLDEILKIYTDNKEAFTVDFEDYEDDEPLIAARSLSKAPASLLQPIKADFPTLVAFIKANALFYLQQRAKEQATQQAAIPGSNL